MSRKKKIVSNDKNEGLALLVSPFDIVKIQEFDEELASEYYAFLEEEFGEESTLGYVGGSFEISEAAEGIASEKLKELLENYAEKTKLSDVFANAVMDKDGLVLLRIVRNSADYLAGSLVTVDKDTALMLISPDFGKIAELYVKPVK